MNQSDDDDEATAAIESPISIREPSDDAELARRAGNGDQRAFDLLYDRYFARTTWYFTTIFARREAERAVREVLTQLFGSLNEASDLSFAERAYRLSVATEHRHVDARKALRPLPKRVSPRPVRADDATG